MSGGRLPVYRHPKFGTEYFVGSKGAGDVYGILMRDSAGVRDVHPRLMHKEDAVKELEKLARERKLVKAERLSL